MIKQICSVSGEEFEVSDLELKLREKFGFFDLPTTAPWVRFRELGAFWQHWNLHNRKCDKTGKNIISVFSEKCPYPIWQKDVWMKENNPPSMDYDFSRDFLSQAWELFQQCPIPHNTGVGNENCEYTDDWWYSKNCYLCHSGYKNEDCKYCYRSLNSRDSYFNFFSIRCELCCDVGNSQSCFDSIYLLNCQRVNSSSFLYDCRNCSNCMFCFNLRNKQYCFGNQQLSKEEYEKKKTEWNLKSRKIYDKAKEFFTKMMIKNAWHRSLNINKCENVYGDHLENCKNMINCFFVNENVEDCVNFLRAGVKVKNILDSFDSCGETELTYLSINNLFNCYMLRFCKGLVNSKFCDYSIFLNNCENCFACCGLVGKKHHIFNKEYSSEEYKKIREKIIEQMKKEGSWGKFFPGYFAPNPYEESWASFYWPISREKQVELGFRLSDVSERKNKNYFPVSDIPDSVDDLGSGQDEMTEEELYTKIFWDEKYRKPFKILPADVKFSRDLGCPLPNSYYMRRIQENFSWMPFNGKLRDCECGKCKEKIQTSWPKKYDQRILCEKCYLDILN